MNYQEMQQLLEQYKSTGGGDFADFESYVNTMASDGATPFLQLNQWKSSDKPVMKDFNEDNQKIDDAVRRISEQKAEKTDVYTKAEANERLNTKVNLNGAVMTGGLEVPGFTVRHGATDWAAIHFIHEDNRTASVYSHKTLGQAMFRVYKPSDDSVYRELTIRWDGDMTWNGKKVLTE